MSRVRQPSRAWMIGIAGALALFACGVALADPPGRVARLTQINGAVSFSPAGEDDWVLAQANRPLVTGDRVWSDTGSRAELQVGSAALRLGSATSVNILNLDDNTAQFQLAQGTLNVRVRRIYGEQVFEVDTPNLAFSIRRPGEYRIDVDPSGNATILRVRAGEGEAWGEGAGYVIGAGQQYTFVGTGLRDYSTDALSPPDEFDRWAFERDRREDAAPSARYVAPDVIGYSDLDEYGAWRAVEGYGNVWVPTSVAVGWAPYHYGRWAWVDPWGWTWVDDAPWGFAPFHYGRWAYLSSRWCWVPGPIAVRPVYAPALVAFVGGGGFSLSLSVGGPVAGIAWFPLGVGEVYRPAYAVSRGYFTNINVSNTVVNTTVINNYYNNVNVTNVVYRNREVAGAVTAVPATAFTGGHAIGAAAVPLSQEVIAKAPVSAVAAVAPSRASVIAAGAGIAGAAAAIVARPSAAVLTRSAVAKVAPPPTPPSFASKAQLLAAQPGKPLEAEKLNALRPAKGGVERNVKVVAPSGGAAAAIKPLPLGKGSTAAGGAAEGAAKGTGQKPGEFRAGPSGAAKVEPGAVPAPPQERAFKEGKGGPPPSGMAQQPPPERTLREGRATPPAGPVPQPPQERVQRESKGAPPGGPVPQPPQERVQKESKGPPPGGPVPQPPQERVQKESKGPPPGENRGGHPRAVSGPPPGASNAPPPQAGRAEAKPEGKREESKAKEKEKDKDKDKKEGAQQ